MKTKILLVDGNQTFSSEVKRILEREGHTVSVATGTGQALDLAKNTSPKIIFLDVEVTPEGGLETYLRIREVCPEAVVVMVTEDWDNLKNLAREAIAHNAYTCLYKPFEIEEMLDLIEIISEESVEKKQAN